MPASVERQLYRFAGSNSALDGICERISRNTTRQRIYLLPLTATHCRAFQKK